jgi:hypothetical protein
MIQFSTKLFPSETAHRAERPLRIEDMAIE